MMILQSFNLGPVSSNHTAVHLLALISLFHSCFGRQVSILYQDREGEEEMWWSIHSMSGQPANHPIKYHDHFTVSRGFAKVTLPESSGARTGNKKA